MGESTFTFRVDDELKAAFAETAKAQDRTAAQLLRTLMRETIEREANARAHDSWFRDEIEQARREADQPNTQRVAHKDVRSNWQRQRAGFVKRVRAKSK